MKNYEILRISCSFVDGSSIGYYEKSGDLDKSIFNSVSKFINGLDLSITGKIQMNPYSSDLLIFLLGTDDFGAPPSSLSIILKIKDKKHIISIPFSNEKYVHLDLFDLVN